MLGFNSISEFPLSTIASEILPQISLSATSALASNGVLLIGGFTNLVSSSILAGDLTAIGEIVPVTAYINQEESIVGYIYKSSETNQYILKILEKNFNINQLTEKDLQLDQQRSITLER